MSLVMVPIKSRPSSAIFIDQAMEKLLLWLSGLERSAV